MTAVLYLKWLDSCGHAKRWTSIDELEFPKAALEHETVGFLLKETEYSYIVVQSKGLDIKAQSNVVDAIEIPKCAVFEKREFVPNNATLRELVPIITEPTS